MAKVVTITNPVTGQPAQVDQLDHTAQQIDDAVEAARWSHRNLLDNAYFANPDLIIDQRGGYVVPPGVAYYEIGTGTQIGTLSTYSNVVRFVVDGSTRFPIIKIGGVEYFASPTSEVRGYTGTGYTIDRWKIGSSGTLTIEDGYITFASSDATLRNLEQVLETLEVGKYTISLLAENASGTNLIIGLGSGFISATISTNEKQVVSLTFDVTTKTSGTVYIQTGNSQIKLYAAKLELGTQQTLAHQDEDGNWVLNDPPPDKGMELLKCQRYQIPIGASAVYSGQTNSSKDTTGAFFIPLPVSMRATPVIANLSLDTWAIRCNGVSKTPTAITVSGITPNGVTCAFACETGFGVRQSVVIYKADGKELLDANL